MKNLKLSHYFSLERRYSRSINLERDLDELSALDGYILTDRSLDTLGRILRGLTNKTNHNCWTLTGVYGTGKSAFAHYLTCLLAPEKNQIKNEAITIINNTFTNQNQDNNDFLNKIPKSGLFRAIAVGQREPIINTIIRALIIGANTFWDEKPRENNPIFKQLIILETNINQGKKVENSQVISLIKQILNIAKTDIIFIFDELGKNLEYAVYNQGAEDLYLLQQLAELEVIDHHRVFVLGILHQAFTEYGQRLAQVQRHEWAKIQGRFEDISFTESTGQMMRLIGLAINHDNTEEIAANLTNYCQEWSKKLDFILSVEGVEKSDLKQVYPLHPLTALVLPTLCMRYAQNDRSLFTFLTSSEPFSLKNFLEEVKFEGAILPTLKLDRIYDYFIEAAGMGLASRPNLQRWVEISDLIADSKRLDHDSLKVLKAIGILNLVTITGVTRATRDLVAFSLCDFPTVEHIKYWQSKIDTLLKQGLITHRRQLNELRIWEGSDFNIDNELQSYLDQEQSSLVKLLSELRPLKPLIAQRHSYKTGTLRYFERHYIDSSYDLQSIECDIYDSDGWLGYWLDENELYSVPKTTKNGLPIIIITVSNLPILRLVAREFSALNRLNNEAKELQTDGVARKEVRYRLTETEQLLNETLATVFDFNNGDNQCFIQGKLVTISNSNQLNIKLSEICDKVFYQSPILWNELINRRNLSSQGTKARRELITAMINNPSQQKLALEGYGPEVSMYYSLLEETKIHRLIDTDKWGFFPPNNKSDNPNLNSLWEAIANFCLSATKKPQTLDKLSEQLAAPPFGVKEGMIPVIVAAVLLYYQDEVGIYEDGTFVPHLRDDHFERLLKNPERFGVKYFDIAGLRREVFHELEAILRNPNQKTNDKLRNATLLSVVTPIYQFAKQLPRYTQNTKQLNGETLKVLQCLQKTSEPDELLFRALPAACNLPPIGTGESDDGETAKTLKTKLIKALREINNAYDKLFSDCRELLINAFGLSNKDAKFRTELQFRAKYLVDKCVEPFLKRFVKAAVDQSSSDSQWLESLMMIIADKPPQSWLDEDLIAFEVKLAEIARRFENLEALQKEAKIDNESLTPRRITITDSTGEETNRIIWSDSETEIQAEEYVTKILHILPDNQKLKEIILTKLTDIILCYNSQLK